MSDSEMRASDEEMDVDMDDPNIKRRGRGFDIRGTAAGVQGDGVRAKNFDRLQGEGGEEGIKAAKCECASVTAVSSRARAESPAPTWRGPALNKQMTDALTPATSILRTRSDRGVGRPRDECP